MSARGSSSSDFPERFQAKACPGRSASAFRRVFDALVSAFTRVFDALWGGAPQARTQNRENNPMQSRIGPTRRTRAAVRPGHERKMVRRHDPNLISSRSSGLKIKNGRSIRAAVLPLSLFACRKRITRSRCLRHRRSRPNRDRRRRDRHRSMPNRTTPRANCHRRHVRMNRCR